RVWSPVRETDLTAHGVVQITHIFIALLAKTLDRLPGVDVLKRHLIDPKVVLADHIKLDLTGAETVIQKPLNDLRGVCVFKADRLQDKVVLKPFSHVSGLYADYNACVSSVLRSDIVAQQAVKNGHKIRGFAPVRGNRRLDDDLIVAVEERAVAISKRQFAPP